MGVSSPNSDFYFVLEILCVFFCVVLMSRNFSKKNKKGVVGGGSGWLRSEKSEFFSVFLFF